MENIILTPPAILHRYTFSHSVGLDLPPETIKAGGGMMSKFPSIFLDSIQNYTDFHVVMMNLRLRVIFTEICVN